MKSYRLERNTKIMDEKNIETKIRNYIHSVGGFSLKYHAGMTTLSGIPDLICTYKGVAIFIEVKASDNYEISEIQKAQIRAIRDCGNIAIVTNKVADVEWIVRELDHPDFGVDGDATELPNIINDMNNSAGIY